MRSACHHTLPTISSTRWASNAFEEIQEAVLLSQRECLVTTETGRQIIQSQIQSTTTLIPLTNRARMQVASIPKNMSAHSHVGRRTAIVHYIRRITRRSRRSVHVDGALYPSPRGNAAVATLEGPNYEELVSFSIQNCTILEAEVAAISLALQYRNATGLFYHTVTDSQVACRLLLLADRIKKKLLLLVTGISASNTSIKDNLDPCRE